MNFDELLRENRRLTILRLLMKAPGYEANHIVMQTALEGIGLPASEEQVIADLRWLEGLGLLRLEKVEGESMCVWIAALTNPGADVARGRVVVPGIRRPLPGGGPCPV